jgi:hypothetical protein
MKVMPSGPWNAPYPLPGSDTPTGWGTPGEQTFRMQHGTTFRMTWGPMTLQLPKPLIRTTYLYSEATWRSGYATVCKTVYPGSIPGVASTRRLKLCAAPAVCHRSFHCESGASLVTRAHQITSADSCPASAVHRRSRQIVRRLGAKEFIVKDLDGNPLLFAGPAK